MTKKDFEERNVLFQWDDRETYIEKLLEKVLATRPTSRRRRRRRCSNRRRYSLQSGRPRDNAGLVEGAI
jgi:hypothetical protein